MGSTRSYSHALDQVCLRFGAASGTLHLVQGEHLTLIHAIDIPPSIQAKIEVIPKGKGMAGHAWLTGEPVQTCNLASDPTTVIQSGARQIDAAAAIALPVRDVNDRVWGVLGMAFPKTYDLTEAAVVDIGVAAHQIFKTLLVPDPS